MEGWKYLWIPPSLPYYNLHGAYQNSWGFSKTLIFSFWKMVPKMIAGLVSYEAERLSVCNKNSISEKEHEEDKREYFVIGRSSRRSPKPQLTFKTGAFTDTPEQINNYMLLYPSFYLSAVYGPVINLEERSSIKQIRKKLAEKIKADLITTGMYEYSKESGDWRKWQWLAPLF